MPVIVHLLLVTLASLFGWDSLRRLSPVSVPGVIARIVIAVIAIVLWAFAPLPILGGMAAVGVLMFVGRYVAVEDHKLWGRHVRDFILDKRQTRGQAKEERVVEQKLSAMGTRFEVKDKIGERIPKL